MLTCCVPISPDPPHGNASRMRADVGALDLGRWRPVGKQSDGDDACTTSVPFSSPCSAPREGDSSPAGMGELAWEMSETGRSKHEDPVHQEVMLVQGAQCLRKRFQAQAHWLICSLLGCRGRVKSLKNLPLFLSLISLDLHANLFPPSSVSAYVESMRFIG